MEGFCGSFLRLVSLESILCRIIWKNITGTVQAGGRRDYVRMPVEFQQK